MDLLHRELKDDSLTALLVTADRAVGDEVGRLAGAAGALLTCAETAAAARPNWLSAPLVLVGSDLVAEVIAAELPRRAGVVLVSASNDVGIWRQAVELGAEHVAFVPAAEDWLVDRLADAADEPSRGGKVVAVVGGSGGAGASTLAVSLALTGARLGHRTLLLDADPLGAGIDLLLGAETVSGLRWPGLLDVRGRVAPQALRQALPIAHGLSFLSWGRGDPFELPGAVLVSILNAAIRGFDLIVVDLPRTPGALATEILARASRTVLITTADVRSAASAAQLLSQLPAPEVALVVRGPAPGGLSAELVAESLDLPLLGFLRPEPGLAEAIERGEPPARRRGPLGELCGHVLADLRLERPA